MTTLRETLAEHEWRPDLPLSAHTDHRYSAFCALCTLDLEAIESVVLAWVGARLEGARDAARLAAHVRHPDPFAKMHADAALSAVLSALGVQPFADEGESRSDRQPGGSTGVVCAIGAPHGPHSIQTFIAGGEPGPVPLLWGRWCPGRDATTCDACPFLGCGGCEAEVARRANGEAK